jgi:NAD(P)-dependent dehydrogenase (short-subunit alcohol dehydrogenase family)
MSITQSKSPQVLITGANRGLGLEFARQYLADGWRVIAGCRDLSQARDLEALQQGRLRICALDVADHASIENAARTLDGEAIDVLINNAGVFGPRPRQDSDARQSFGSMHYGIWEDVLRVNLFGAMKMTECFVAHVAASEQKKIVAVSSVEGSIAQAKGGIYAYKTSKAALNMLMRNLAPDLAPRGIVTAAFCPGWIKTRMGGASAPLEAPPCIAGLRQCIAELTVEKSGRFWLWKGSELPW